MACTSSHDGRVWGVNIQLSSLNFKTITRGELSQLAHYCLKLKISASTGVSEATFGFIETILPLNAKSQEISAPGASSLALFFCLVLLLTLNNKRPQARRLRGAFPI